MKTVCLRLMSWLVAGALFGSVPAAFAGQLDAFEKAAIQRNDRDDSHRFADEDDGWLGQIFWDCTVGLLVVGASASLARIQDDADPADSKIELRQKGEPTLPFLRADLHYQYVNSHVAALDGRLELGYGPVGLQYRHTHYWERHPSDSLGLSQIHGLFRVSGSRAFAVDLGFGAVILNGKDSNSGASVTLPICYYPWKNFGLRVRPTWSAIKGNVISDYDLSISYSIKFLSVEAGYRFNRVHDQRLDGPYIGLSFHY
jgi:hypothetical protein